MDDQIAQFVSLTSSTPQEAQSYLTQAGRNLETAVGLFFAAADDGEDAGEEDQLMDDDDDEEAAPAHPHAPSHAAPAATAARTGGGNSMGGGASEPLPAGWGQGGGGGSGARVGRVGQWGGPGGQGSTPARTGNGPRIATLGSMNSSGPSAGGGRGGPPGGGDDDSSDEEKGEDLYAGGERSGLNIQNPNKNKGPAGAGAGRGVVADILKKAQEAGPPPAPPGSSAGPSGSFAPSWGSGNTLGSDTTPSSSIADPNAPAAGDDEDDEEEEEESAVRHLTFWRDGFSIEDGELRRYDQPGNRELLEAINQGRAPPSLLNVRVNQPVEVRVAKRLEEDWKPAPPKPKGPWEGSGNRLGAPVPGLSSPPSSSAAAPATATATEASSTTGSGSSAGGNLQFEVDMTEPTTQLQIRLGDGTRLVARVNFTHTIGDVRRFINASRPSSTRSYALQTTFPNKDLVDETQTIKEAGLGGAVVVQRWT